MSKFRYPVDNDQFVEIRRKGQFYIDKTDMIYDLVSKYKYVFLARPRRFGKSLLCNTFKAYFNGQRDLFEGLKIIGFEKVWKKYPVFHFNMGCLKNRTISEAKRALELSISDYEEIYGQNHKEKTPGKRFRGLIHRAYEKTGEEVVVIIDEYDSAIMQLLYKPKELEAMHTMLREFYQVLKDEGAYLKFVFITGITKFSQLSIYSELNNLYQISMNDDYSGICGITQHELETTLRPCIEEYAKELDITTDEAYILLKKNYDGYRFSSSSQSIYNPFSILRALNDHSTNHYWFESGTTTSLIEYLKHYPTFNPLDYDGVELSQGAFDAPCEKANTPIPLLYQSGYLTIESYNRDLKSYTLHFPNHEVRQGMIEGMTNYLMGIDDLERDAAILEMARALKKGGLSKALTILRSSIASIPYEIIAEKHEAFYKLLLYIVFSLLNSKVDTEVKSVLGRADVVIKTSSNIFVLELKVNETVENAIDIPYEADGRDVIKCGISISSKDRNITHWKMIDMNHNVIDEQRF